MSHILAELHPDARDSDLARRSVADGIDDAAPLIDAARPCPRAVDQQGQVITGGAPARANVIEGLIPAAIHNTAQYENNPRESDHGRLKARRRPTRGLKTDRTARLA